MSRTFSTFFEILFLKLFGSDRQQLLYLITDLSACQELFLSFLKNFLNFIFQKFSSFLSATFTSYHRWSCLSRTFFIFLKNFFKFLSSSSATSDIIPYTYPLVNNFLQKNLIFLYFLFTIQTQTLQNPFIYWQTSHFYYFNLFLFYSHFYYRKTFIITFSLTLHYLPHI